MGLDQYMYIANKAGTHHDDPSRQELGYRRKHPNLHGWMHQLWERKGNSGVFNGDELELTWEDIDCLEKDIKLGKVAELDTKGFFFGNPSDEHYYDYDLKFCVDAKTETFLGRKVFYNSSW